MYHPIVPFVLAAGMLAAFMTDHVVIGVVVAVLIGGWWATKPKGDARA